MKEVAGSITIPDEATDQEINEVAEWLESTSFEDLQIMMNSYKMAKAELFARQIGVEPNVH